MKTWQIDLRRWHVLITVSTYIPKGIFTRVWCCHASLECLRLKKSEPNVRICDTLPVHVKWGNSNIKLWPETHIWWYIWPDYIITWSDYIIIWPDYIIIWPDYIIIWPDYIIIWPDYMIIWPDYIIIWPDYMIIWPDYIIICIETHTQLPNMQPIGKMWL